MTVAGKKRMYYGGDWVDIGEQTAIRLITDGLARTSDPALLTNDFTGAGVLAYGEDKAQVEQAALLLRKLIPGLAVQTADEPKLSFSRNLFWNVACPVRPELVSAGLRLLRTWEIAAVVYSYDELASAHGTPEDRTKTAQKVHDLRVPVYDERLLFVKRCRVGQEFLKAWREESGEPKLALLRSLYTVKALLCPLPVTWLKNEAA
jgi:hypothetical protein